MAVDTNDTQGSEGNEIDPIDELLKGYPDEEGGDGVKDSIDEPDEKLDLDGDETTAEATEDKPEGKGKDAVNDTDDAKTDATETNVDKKGASADTKEAADAVGDVLTKDGKNTIPYSVLEETRERANAARLRAEEQEEQIRLLTEQINAQKKGEATQEVGEIELLSEDELAVIEEDMPTLAKQIREQQALIAKQREVLEQSETEREEMDKQRMKAAGDEVQQAIDGNAKLAYLQASNPELWQAAVDIDKDIRNTARYQNKSLSERFEDIVLLVEKDHGKIVIPSTPDPKEVEKLANEKIVDKSTPKSLSDLPTDEAGDGINEDLSNASAAQIGERMTKFGSSDQILDFLKQ